MKFESLQRIGARGGPARVGEEMPEVPGREYLPRLGAGCVLVLGLALFGGAFAAIVAAQAGGSIAGIIAALATGAGLIAAGIFSIRYIAEFERRERELFEEKVVLSAAAGAGGALTPAQIALLTPLTLADVERVMLRLCRQGVAGIELDPMGGVRYRFRGLVDGDEPDL
jgi:hypothetical protein